LSNGTRSRNGFCARAEKRDKGREPWGNQGHQPHLATQKTVRMPTGDFIYVFGIQKANLDQCPKRRRLPIPRGSHTTIRAFLARRPAEKHRGGLRRRANSFGVIRQEVSTIEATSSYPRLEKKTCATVGQNGASFRATPKNQGRRRERFRRDSYKRHAAMPKAPSGARGLQGKTHAHLLIGELTPEQDKGPFPGSDT